MLHHVEKHIERVREKPDAHKKRYAFFVSGGITVVIFLFWLASFNIGGNTSAVAAQVKSPVSSVTASAADAFGYIKDVIFGANKTDYSSDNIEVVAGKN